MPGALPDGEPVPTDGSLPVAAAERAGRRGFGVDVHVPFCASRCGYCDFNTYTATEAGQEGYVDAVLEELRLAAKVVSPPRVDTVFVGGGTPTLLPPGDLARILDGIDAAWGYRGRRTPYSPVRLTRPAARGPARRAPCPRTPRGSPRRPARPPCTC